MGRDGLLNTCCLGLSFDHDQDHHSCQMLSVAVQEHIVFLAGFDGHVATVVKPEFQFLDGFLGDGHQPLFRAFTHNPHIFLFQIQIRKFQVYQFTHTQSAGEQHLDDGAVTVSFPF